MTSQQPTTLATTEGKSSAEILEMVGLGIVRRAGVNGLTRNPPPDPMPTHLVKLEVPGLLNEAESYGSAFARATLVQLKEGDAMLLVSGTASVGSAGETLYRGDFRAQCWRTYRNITGLLNTAHLTWFDVLRATCYLRDIERDYADFNQIRTWLFNWLGVHPYPSSTGIQAILCRPELLIEIEVLALRRGNATVDSCHHEDTG